MILLKRIQLVPVLFCVTTVALAEERLGLQGIVDGTLTNVGLSSSSPSAPRSQTNLNGQLVFLGSLRLRKDLFVFYEGRVNHTEGLNGSSPRLQQTHSDSVFQAYVRYSPRLPGDLNVQIGRFGTPFGHFLTRNYSNQNPLIGFPLIYTHKTSIRSSQVPRGPASLIAWRDRLQGAGSYGYRTGGTELPLINFSYPTGVLAFGNPGKLDYRVALVNSSLANPINLGTPGQRIQWIAAGGYTCLPRLHLGTSLAQGPYLDASASPGLPLGTSINDFKQRALGFDLQYAVGHLEVYGELLFNDFKLPNIPQRLGATGYFLELKYTWTPRLFTAIRWNQIYFDRLRSGFSGASQPRFDYNVNRLEVGVGYRFTEKLLVKVSSQHNRTLASRDPADNVFGAQVVYTFDVRNLLGI